MVLQARARWRTWPPSHWKFPRRSCCLHGGAYLAQSGHSGRGSRSGAAMSAPYGLAALEQECAKLAATTSGRNHQLNVSSFAMGQLAGAGLLDWQDAEKRLLGAAQANGYAAKDGIAAARATIRSGFDAGVLQPRGIPNGAAAIKKLAARPVLPTGFPVLPTGTPGAKFVASSADDSPEICDELPNRRHVYRRGGQPVRAKIKRASGGFIDLYRVTHPETGEIGWQPKKPEGYVVTPYVGAIDPFTEARTSPPYSVPRGRRTPTPSAPRVCPHLRSAARATFLKVARNSFEAAMSWCSLITMNRVGDGPTRSVLFSQPRPRKCGSSTSLSCQKAMTSLTGSSAVAPSQRCLSGLRQQGRWNRHPRPLRRLLSKATILLRGQIPTSLCWVLVVGRRRRSPQTYFGDFGTIGSRVRQPESRHRKIMWPPLFLRQPVPRWAMFDGLLRELGGVNLPFSGVVS